MSYTNINYQSHFFCCGFLLVNWEPQRPALNIFFPKVHMFFEYFLAMPCVWIVKMTSIPKLRWLDAQFSNQCSAISLCLFLTFAQAHWSLVSRFGLCSPCHSQHIWMNQTVSLYVPRNDPPGEWFACQGNALELPPCLLSVTYEVF